MGYARGVITQGQGILHARAPPQGLGAEAEFHAVMMKTYRRMSPVKGRITVGTKPERTVDAGAHDPVGTWVLCCVAAIAVPVDGDKPGKPEIPVLLVDDMGTKAEVQELRGNVKSRLQLRIQTAPVPCRAVIFAVGQLAVNGTFQFRLVKAQGEIF